MRFFELLIFQVWYSSSVQCFQIIGILFQHFRAIIDGIRVLACFNLRLSCIESKNFKNLNSLSIIIIFNELNTFFIKFVSLFKFSFFECLISLIFCICSLGNFFFITHFPFLFNFILEIKKFNLKVQCWVWWNSWRWASFAISVIWWADKGCSFSSFHGSKSFIPTFNDSSLTQIKFKGTVSVLVRIELSSIF